LGSNYEISFIKFGRQYKVIVQAAPQYRALPEEDFETLCKKQQRRRGTLLAFMHLEKVYGLSEITRHNMYNASRNKWTSC
jgi:HAE1 family hydrophobic/amphiphilic exporter-1